MTFQLFGLPVSRGIAIGRAVLVASSRIDVAHYYVGEDQVDAEIDRLRVARDAQRPTGTCVVLVAPGGERTMLPDPGANDALSIDDLPDDAFAGGVLHVSGYALLRHGSRAAALTAIDRARAAGRSFRRALNSLRGDRQGS